MALLPEIEFASCLVYAPQGNGDTSKLSKEICYKIKNDRWLKVSGVWKRAIPYVASVFKFRLGASDITEWFSSNPILVPAPRSGLLKPNSLHPARRICDELVGVGLGSETRLLLERAHPVQKAAGSPSHQRPTFQQHYDSLVVKPELLSAPEILLVDDVVTQGTMSLACVSRLKEVYPNSKIRAFALVRTMSNEEVTKCVDIQKGTIRREGNWGKRRP